MGKHLIQNSEPKRKKSSLSLPKVQSEKKEKTNKAKDMNASALHIKSEKFRNAAIGLSLTLLAVLHFTSLFGWKYTAAYLFAFLIALASVIFDAAERLLEKKYFADEIIICISGIAIFCTGLYFEASLLIILFGAERILIKFFSERSRKEYERISDIIPDKANAETPEGVIEVSPEYINVGDIFTVNPGERIPVDGIITEGITTVDTSPVSGQKTPWAVSEKYRIYSGCVNLTSTIRARAVRPFNKSTAYRLAEISAEAAEFRSSQEHTAEKISSYYSKIFTALALITAVIVPFFKGAWFEYLRRAAIILIAARPTIFAVTLPMIYLKGVGLSSDKGIFMKGTDCIESIARSDSVIFDKTGTVTEGRYTITEVYPEKISERDLLTIAAAAEFYSHHPIARAIKEAVGRIDEQKLKIMPIEELAGRGISSFVASKQVYVGNTYYLEEHGINCSVPQRSGAAIHVAVDNIYCGYILIADKLRRGAFDALENMRASGVSKMILLTGDVLSVARPIASKLNFDMLRAELKQDEKASSVEYLMANKGEKAAIAFIGDAERSGELMRKVNVGISMGSLGSEEAFSNADVMIMDRDIKKLPWIFRLSRQIFKVASENMIVGLAANLLIVVFGFLGVLPVLVAEIAEFLFMTAILTNTLRIK